MLQEFVSIGLTVFAPLLQKAAVCHMVCFFFSFELKNALHSVFERIPIFTMLDSCVFLCYFSSTVHTSVKFDHVFFNMYSLTKFVIFVTKPSLFTNTILLEHAFLHQRAMHCPLLACVCLMPCTFLFQAIHRSPSKHTPPVCGVVSNRHSTIGDGFIQHKAHNIERWIVNTTQVCHWAGGGGSTPGFPHCTVKRGCGTLKFRLDP